MASVQDVFDMAIHLMDAQNESTGATRTTDTNEYALRTPNILNTLLDQVYPYSDTYPDLSDGAKTRPSLDSVTSLDDYLDLDDYICRNVLPYGLAGLLLTEENPTQANFFWQTYPGKSEKHGMVCLPKSRLNRNHSRASKQKPRRVQIDEGQ